MHKAAAYANSSFWAILWCFGGKVVEADSVRVTPQEV
jgi:hypothetical protein